MTETQSGNSLQLYLSRAHLTESNPGRSDRDHILSHTSGLASDWRSGDQPLKIAFTPGEKWSYSGEGYYYLQSIVTELTGRTDPNQCDTFEAGLKVCATDFGEYMESRLVVPFGRRSSGYVPKEWFDSHRARPHDVKGSPLPIDQTAQSIGRGMVPRAVSSPRRAITRSS